MSLTTHFLLFQYTIWRIIIHYFYIRIHISNIVILYLLDGTEYLDTNIDVFPSCIRIVILAADVSILISICILIINNIISIFHIATNNNNLNFVTIHLILILLLLRELLLLL